jgi:hypothetical protein
MATMKDIGNRTERDRHARTADQQQRFAAETIDQHHCYECEDQADSRRPPPAGSRKAC